MEWRVIPGFSKYEVSEIGLVRRTAPYRKTSRGPWLKPRVGHRGHLLYVAIRDDNGDIRALFAHKAVLFAFVGPQPPGTECCHNDGDPSNNHFSNLRWCTRKENAQDMCRHGRVLKGQEHSRAKLDPSKVVQMRRLHDEEGVNYARLAAQFGVSAQVVRDVCRRELWKWVE
jgi:hypothetical protein